MYTLPENISNDLKANDFLTMHTIKFLTKAAMEEAIYIEEVFVFQVGILSAIEHDLKEFATDGKDQLIKQYRDFYRCWRFAHPCP